jgi:uncharacterized protein YdhG (YjbR/CyaY superfamily)
MTTQPATRSTAAKDSNRFSNAERAAMRERARELKTPARSDTRNNPEDELLAKIAEMHESDRKLAERLHAIVTASIPSLSPKTWYGMPAYAKGNDLVCFFQPAQKFKTRYATLGFSDKANLDEGNMWPTYYALKELAPADEARIVALIKQAAA